MSIPDYQSIMLPMLKILDDGQEWVMRDLTKRLADDFKLSDAERDALLQSGEQTVISNRVAWAKTYLKKAGLLENPTRGKIRISAEGKQLLAEKHKAITVDLLKRFPSFGKFIDSRTPSKPTQPELPRLCLKTKSPSAFEPIYRYRCHSARHARLLCNATNSPANSGN